MTLVFAHPKLYAMPHAMHFSAPPCYYSRMHRPCAPSRCFDGFFAALLMMLFLPAIVKVGLCVLGAVLYVASHLAFGALIVWSLSTLASLACGELNTEDGATPCFATRPVRKPCPSTRPSTVREEERTEKQCASARPSTVREDDCTHTHSASTRPTTVREELAKKHETRRHDLSTVRVEEKADMIRVVLAMPGVRASDVAVSVLDRELRVAGESSRDGATYSVDRRIGLPYDVDVDSAQATHAHGEMAIEFQRKTGTRIAVVRRDAEPAETAPSKEADKEDVDAKTE